MSTVPKGAPLSADVLQKKFDISPEMAEMLYHALTESTNAHNASLVTRATTVTLSRQTNALLMQIAGAALGFTPETRAIPGITPTKEVQ